MPPRDEPPEGTAAPDQSRFLSITLSPLHLLIGPIFELQLEAMVTPHFGASGIFGVGSIKAEASQSGVGTQKFSAYELGLQLAGYPLREFSSLQLGAELLWIKVSAANVNGQEISAEAGGVAVGPFLGYKVLTDAGFTFVAQGGFQYLAVAAEASDTAGNSATAEQANFIPLLNLNLGWSF